MFTCSSVTPNMPRTPLYRGVMYAAVGCGYPLAVGMHEKWGLLGLGCVVGQRLDGIDDVASETGYRVGDDAPSIWPLRLEVERMKAMKSPFTSVVDHE